MTALPDVYQYANVSQVISPNANETLVFVDITPFKPADLVIQEVNGGISITGFYGGDVFTNHEFVILLNGQLVTYNKIDDLPAAFDNVIKFYPDPTHDKTFTINFQRVPIQTDPQVPAGSPVDDSATQYVHADNSVWIPVLKDILTRETNGRSS